MERLASTAACSAWSGYHLVSATVIAASISGLRAPIAALTPSMALPDPSFAGTAAALAFAGAHLALGLTQAGAAIAMRRSARWAERAMLTALAAGIGLAVAVFALGLSAWQPGTYAFCLAATLLALGFDRMVTADEFDDSAIVREGLLVAARLGRGHSFTGSDTPNAEGFER